MKYGVCGQNYLYNNNPKDTYHGGIRLLHIQVNVNYIEDRSNQMNIT